jgi:hypothetical protein
MEKATTWLRPASLASSGSYALSSLMSRLWLFAVSIQERLLYGKKKGLYWVIVSIGTKEVILWITRFFNLFFWQLTQKTT